MTTMSATLPLFQPFFLYRTVANTLAGTPYEPRFVLAFASPNAYAGAQRRS
jgi:hypothetical protein